ncbi:hypothetical protein Dimus_017664 [Dionaea muscipula]
MVAHAVVMPDEEEEQERSGTSCRQLDGGDNCWLPWFWAIGLRTDSGKVIITLKGFRWGNEAGKWKQHG